MRRVCVVSCVLVVLGCNAVPASAQPAPSPLIESSRMLLKDLVGINTADPDGNTTTAATLIADSLKAAGFPPEDVQVIGADARRGNLVARLRGRGTGKPVLFIAHLDVVPALREDFVPDRDLVLALTTGEEQGSNAASNGIMWLLKHHRDLIDAAYVINGDVGGGRIAQDGRYISYGVQAGEKLYADFALEATHDGGHSSRPVAGNPIYRMARALSRVEALQMPLKVDSITRPYLAFLATVESGSKAADLRAAQAGIDVYGVYHFERDEDQRAHGKDERIGVQQFDEAARFGYELAKIIGRSR